MASSNKTYTFSVPVGRFWKVYVPLAIVVGFSAVFIGISGVDFLVMPHIVGINRDMVQVPAISGLELEQGREKLFAVGLLTEIRSRDYDNNVPENSIINQVPEAGNMVKKGRRILVAISKGKEISVIPDIKNLTERQARIELKKKGIMVVDVKKIFDEKQQTDLVIEASPQCGTSISREMKVTLIISKGPKPTSVEMPNIVGESQSEAQKKIIESGLKVGKIGYRNDPSLQPGTVISQSVSPGDNVPLETAVDINVSVIQ